jgi:chemotaxis family two-component system response regulator Rcp1
MAVQVLLIEDNRPDALLVRNALQKQGLDFSIHELRDAEAASSYAQRMGSAADVPYPDIVIMDLNLPKGDGLEILEAIRNCPECADTPVIVMTSSDSPRHHARVAEMGNTRYFRKPLDLDAFLGIGALVVEVLNERDAPGK